MQIKFSGKFNKKYRKTPAYIQRAFKKRLQLFIADPYMSLLNNHSLSGIWNGYRSINITGDWRALFREFNDGNLIYFEIMGTHSELYKK